MTTRNAEAGAVVLLSAGLVGLMALGVGCIPEGGPSMAGEAAPAPVTGLPALRLNGTRITDAGLVHLEGLTGLRELRLPREITDAGLAHLKGLTELRVLFIPPQITDAGLAHLEGLTGLRTLHIPYFRVTDAGVRALDEALPRWTARH